MIALSNNALYTAVGAASAQITFSPTNRRWLVTSTTACWIKLGDDPTAAANTAGNTYLPADTPVIVGHHAKLAVIQASAGGHLTATMVQG